MVFYILNNLIDTDAQKILGVTVERKKSSHEVNDRCRRIPRCVVELAKRNHLANGRIGFMIASYSIFETRRFAERSNFGRRRWKRNPHLATTTETLKKRTPENTCSDWSEVRQSANIDVRVGAAR